MPIYEFECANKKCGNIIEEIVMGGKPTPVTVGCSKCGASCYRIMSASSFKINGKYTAKTGYAYEGQNRPLPGGVK